MTQFTCETCEILYDDDEQCHFLKMTNCCDCDDAYRYDNNLIKINDNLAIKFVGSDIEFYRADENCIVEMFYTFFDYNLYIENLATLHSDIIKHYNSVFIEELGVDK